MKRTIIVLVLLLALIGITSAISYCGNQNFYFSGADSDIAGYKVISNVPSATASETITVDVIDTTSPKFVGNWTMPANATGAIIVDPAVWTFNVYMSVNPTTGTTRGMFMIYNRSEDGTETELLPTYIVSAPVLQSGVTLYQVPYINHDTLKLNKGDRITVRMYVQTTNTLGVNFTFHETGTNYNSNLYFGYMDCGSSSTSSGSATVVSKVSAVPMNPFTSLAAIAIALILLVVLAAIEKKE